MTTRDCRTTSAVPHELDQRGAQRRHRVLDSLLTDDFAGVGPLGFVLPKAAWVGRHQSGDLVYETFDVDEVATHPHGDFVLVVARHVAKGAYQGHPIPEAARASLAGGGGGGGGKKKKKNK